MIEELNDWIRSNVKCCACGGSMETSECISMIVLKKMATWKFPVFGQIDIPGYWPRAMAVICDECRQNEVKIRRCIEWEGSPYQVIYHEVEDLKDINEIEAKMKYYFGKKLGMSSATQNKLMLKAAREQSVN